MGSAAIYLGLFQISFIFSSAVGMMGGQGIIGVVVVTFSFLEDFLKAQTLTF